MYFVFFNTLVLRGMWKKFGWHSKKRHGEGALKEREEVAQKQEQFLLQHSFS